MYPPTRAFILDPLNWHSLGAAVSVTVGSLYDASQYPLTNLVDGSAGPITRFATQTVGVQVTLAAEQNVNLIGLLNHNLDPQLLIQPYIDGLALPRTFSVNYPHCWIDLRGFAASGTTFELRVSGNAKPISCSEIVVADAALFEGVIEVPLPEVLQARTSRARTDHGVLLEASTGTLTRAFRVRLQLGPAEQTLLQTIWDRALTTNLPILIAPSSRKNDLWLLPAPAVRVYEYARSYQLATTALEGVENAPGVV